MNKYLNSSNLEKGMGKLNVIFIFIFLFSLTLVSAEAIGQRQNAELNQPYIISQPCASCTYINISVFTKEGVILDNVPMTDNGSTWTYTFTPTNQTRYDVNGIGDINGIDDSFAFYFEVSPINVPAIIFMLIILCAVIIGLSIMHKRTDFDKWYKNILAKDELGIKGVFAAIKYSFMKDIYLLYYLIGFPIIFLLTDLITYFNLQSIASIFEVFARIYTVGLVVPGLIILMNIITIVKEMAEDLTNKNWGIE